MKPRLGFHYHVPAASIDGNIYMPGYQGRFIDSLASYCERVTCFLHSPRAAEEGTLDYCITSPNVTLVDIGPHLSTPRRLLGARRFVRPIRDRRQDLDALLIRGPSPLLPAITRAVAGLPVVLLLVGDMLAGIDDLPQPRWRKEAIRLVSRWNRWRQNYLARNCLTFVNSRRLYEQLEPFVSHLIETRTTTLSVGDFYQRVDTCISPPYHLLYTGRLDRTKGLLDLVKALAFLVAQGEDVILDLVGWPQQGDNILDELQSLAKERGIAARINYHGFKPLGSELFAFYQKADIYLIASYHEGFPRTIWEAMAHSLPVVATKVGSIPDLIQGAAELVEPRRPQQLAAAILRIIRDSKLRRGYIEKGLSLASESTLEFQVSKMMATIKNRLGRHE